MPRFEDTPKWKRQMRWDPVAQKMVRPDRPPTRKQLDYLRDLSRRRGVEFVRPETRRHAQSAIDNLLNAKRRGSGKAAVKDAM